MPTIDTYPPGTPSWVDLSSPDLAASTSFYTSLFSWDAHDQGEEAGHYTIMELGNKPVAGAGPIAMEGQPPAWTTYVSVADADATVEKIKGSGGTVFLEPMDVMDAGRMAVFADPTGAACAIWQPRDHKGAGLVNEPGALVWNELNTRDTKTAASFYSAVFGWVPETSSVGGDVEYTEWKLNGHPIGGMLAMPAMVPAEVPPHWLAYFGTADCDVTVANAQREGATVVVPPNDIPAGRFSVLVDPNGAVFAVIARPEGSS
jgi:uncharacterized protein